MQRFTNTKVTAATVEPVDSRFLRFLKPTTRGSGDWCFGPDGATEVNIRGLGVVRTDYTPLA